MKNMKISHVLSGWCAVLLAVSTPAATVEEIGLRGRSPHLDGDGSAGASPYLGEISQLVSDGRWQEARRGIELELAQPGLSFQAREAWLFQRERLARIRLDFDKTRAQVLREARAIVPALDEEMFARWEKAGAVEYLDIDGERWFFHRAADNLFRIHPEARQLKTKGAAAATAAYRLEDIRRILAACDQAGDRFNSPKTWRVTYGISVKAGAVPAGEVIRAWLPLPREGERQKDLRLVSVEPAVFVRSPKEISGLESLDRSAPSPQPSPPVGEREKTQSPSPRPSPIRWEREKTVGTGGVGLTSLYVEKPALEREPTRFKVTFEYTASGFHQPIDPAQVRPVSTNLTELAPFLVEQPPHFVFSDELKKLSREIVGQETNSYLRARRLFQWVDEHIPWAGAREYSTLDSLTDYVLRCRHGDCGIQTTLFMTLCRFNGIPARWESGWTTGPDKNMHDWCEIYLAPYGWVPVDVSYGLVISENEREKWFYLGGIDSYRMVVNTDFQQPLYPAKMFFRSEIIDFQRGEVEWRGGNLYFDQWDWDFQVEELSPKPGLDAKTRPGNK